MLLSPASTSGSLPSQSFWNRIKSKKGIDKESEFREKQAQMALARQRLLTLAYEDMETVRVLPSSYPELEAVARDWTKPPPDAMFSLRVPVEFASLHASRLVSGPYIYLTGEDSYQIAIMGVQGLRVEIVADVPPPPEEPEIPPEPPVTEMGGVFNLELVPGQQIALETTITSVDDADMAHMEDGSKVEGMFWGKLDIVHAGDDHRIEFTGTRMANPDITPEFMFDSRVMTKLTTAAKPTTAKCHLSILAPALQYCDVILTFSQFWKLALTWPPAETLSENKVKYFLRVHPGGALEHFENEMVATSLYYEAQPDATMVDPNEFIAPRNGYAMSFRDFIPHLMIVLDQLGMSLHARTNFINNNLSAFSAHKNIAYRFLPPTRIAAAVDISVTSEPCVFTRLFLIFRGLSDDDLGLFAGAGEKEANSVNWREIVGWSENSKDPTQFRVLETSILEVT
ncbi:hypothetical protein BJ138DRAFT_1153526 [Hygrophoropsis aurantiaca]|uniref:Uncharacterized protein n=1 Tax=Hygrophoropsis aurantiaca TaxID=72124 RepID=A0ACB8AAT5_9AGAM|nr:hypothetical protein BJ138DRAFT_1153526 [Hygrophoropsis aurantiaca]